MFIFTSISNGSEFWSVSHNSTCKNSEFKVLKILKGFQNFLVKYITIDQTIYWEQAYTSLMNQIDNNCW